MAASVSMLGSTLGGYGACDVSLVYGRASSIPRPNYTLGGNIWIRRVGAGSVLDEHNGDGVGSTRSGGVEAGGERLR